MNSPTLFETQRITVDTAVLPAYTPVPGYGVLPVNGFVIHAAEPIVIDTGLAAVSAQFIDALRKEIDLNDLRWIWLTHTDPDHIGALDALLEAAPNARIVTPYLGMGKLGLTRNLAPERYYLLNPGQALNLGDRSLFAVTMPSFDAPETIGAFDGKTNILFSSDCFGAVLPAPEQFANDIDAGTLRDGVVTWTTVDAPWLSLVDKASFGRTLKQIADLKPSHILGSHLPPANDMLQTLLRHLVSARTAPPFVGPDQAALMAMLSAA